MTPAPLQVGQAPSELELNSAGLTPFSLAKALRIGSSRPGVRRRVAAARPADGALVDHHDAVAPGDRAVDQRALARAGDAGEHAQHAERDVDVDVLQVVRGRAADLHGRSDDARTASLSDARSSRWRPVTVSLARSSSTVPSKQTVPPAVPAPGPEVDHVVGDRDGLGLVLDHEHGVALVAQPQQQVVHPLDVVGVQADGRLVEDVGDVGQRRARGGGSSWCAGPRRRTACPRAGRARGSPGRSR